MMVNTLKSGRGTSARDAAHTCTLSTSILSLAQHTFVHPTSWTSIFDMSLAILYISWCSFTILHHPLPLLMSHLWPNYREVHRKEQERLLKGQNRVGVNNEFKAFSTSYGCFTVT
jgi:hypothetical protein